LLELLIRIVRREEFAVRKREPIAAYRSQATNLIGDADCAPLRHGFF
jgi:hypothetical protein